MVRKLTADLNRPPPETQSTTLQPGFTASAALRPSTRASGWEWAQSALLALTLAWTTLGLGGYLPSTMVTTAPLLGALFVLHLVPRIVGRDAALPIHPAGWLMLPFVVYAAGNAWWVSPVPWLAWFDWFGWAAMFVVFWVTLNGLRNRGPRQLVFFTLVALALINVFLGCYQRFVNPDWLMLGRTQVEVFHGRASGSFGNPNSMAALLLLLLPATAALALRRRAHAAERIWWGWVTLVLGFGLILPISRGAWIALAVALSLWPLLAGRGGIGRRVLLASGAFAAVLLGSAIVIAAAPKVRQRFVQLASQMGEPSRPIVWRAAWQLWREAPAFGTGAGSFDICFERHRPELFRDRPQWAHNEYLNTLSDYGAAGLLLLLGGTLAVAIRSVTARPETDASARGTRDWLDDRKTLGGVGIGLLAFGLHAGVDYHLKIPALGLMFATLAGLFVSRAWPVRRAAASPAPARWRRATVSVAVGLAWAGAIGLVFTPAFHAEALRFGARGGIDRLAVAPASVDVFEKTLRRARQDLLRAVAADPRNGQAWSDLAYATVLVSGIDRESAAGLAREAESAAGQAIARCDIVYEFWIRRGIARDQQGRWVEAGDDFVRALQLAPRSGYVWYYQAEHLSLRRTERKLAEAALAFCLRLDPGNPSGLALRQRLAINPQVQ